MRAARRRGVDLLLPPGLHHPCRNVQILVGTGPRAIMLVVPGEAVGDVRHRLRREGTRVVVSPRASLTPEGLADVILLVPSTWAWPWAHPLRPLP